MPPAFLVAEVLYPLTELKAEDGAALLAQFEDSGHSVPTGYPFYFWDDGERHYFPEPMAGLEIKE